MVILLQVIPDYSKLILVILDYFIFYWLFYHRLLLVILVYYITNYF